MIESFTINPDETDRASSEASVPSFIVGVQNDTVDDVIGADQAAVFLLVILTFLANITCVNWFA